MGIKIKTINDHEIIADRSRVSVDGVVMTTKPYWLFYIEPHFHSESHLDLESNPKNGKSVIIYDKAGPIYISYPIEHYGYLKDGFLGSVISIFYRLVGKKA